MRARLCRWLVLICFALFVSAIAWHFLARTDPLAREVDRLVIAMPARPKQATIDDLLALGPRVIPHLARNARDRDTPLVKWYRVAQGKLPKGVQQWFKRPRDRGPIRAAAMEAIVGLGPLAVWGAAPAVIEGLSDPVGNVRVHAQYGIEWLVPQYPGALAAYRQVLADTNQSMPVRNLFVSEPIWPKVPGLVPILVQRLAQPEYAGSAAIALHFSASNAVAAVPSLIQTLDHGFAAPYPADRLRPTYTQLDNNRAMAAQALGAIGVASPEVIAALARAWNHTNSFVREKAANAIGLLSSNITALPAELIQALDDRDNGALIAKLNALARVGAPARGALEAIERFTDTDYVLGWVVQPNKKVMYLRVEDIVIAATVTICRLDPERCRTLIPELATHIDQAWSPFLQPLRELSGHSNEVIRAVEPLLTATNDQGRSTWAAYVILGHNNKHEGAIAALQRNKTQGSVTARRVAAERLYDSTGDTNGVWQMIDDGLAPDSTLGQWSINWAGKMGAAAIPILRLSLWHKNQFVRQNAGLWLRKLAPDELKPKPADLANFQSHR